MNPSPTNPSSDIVKLFNPNVLGPAPKMTLSGYPTTINDTGFNLAVTGHNTLSFCSCLTRPDDGSPELTEVVELNFEFQSGTLDTSFFTPDCFHFTVKGHEELAKGLWNNMFQPEGEKFMLETFSEPIKLICPSEEHPYIYTRPKPAGPPSTTSAPHTPMSTPSSASPLQPKFFLFLLAMACPF
ncbi:hypothetical protein JZ751_002924 [Albula glossodonta]|uniref:Uncharacterized protein n=1 Tax=Albula glossodonta TaxID=121402 RepID=A0A8T2NJH9_9TELE|nr:hypothetical protein JZ751_002924 [Albula glossodonta]